MAARPRFPTAPRAIVTLILAAATAACAIRRSPPPPVDPSPAVGVWVGLEGLSGAGYRQWKFDVRTENIRLPGKQRVMGGGQYTTQAGRVCELQFLADFYPDSVPRLNLAIAGNSAECLNERYNLFAAVPLDETLIGQLQDQASGVSANVTLRRDKGR